MFAFALATTALAGTAMVALPGTPAVAQQAVPGKPQYGVFGFDASGMDRNIAPGNDFYGFAMGQNLYLAPVDPFGSGRMSIS